MKKKLSLLTLLIMSTTYSSAQKKINWEDALELLQQNNLGLKQSVLREQISKNNVEIARASFYPTLSFSANNQHTMGLTFDQISGKLITGDQWSNYASGTVSSNIVLYGANQRQNNLKLEKLNFALADLDTKRLKRELDLQLLSIFTQTLINHDLNRAAESQLMLSDRLLELEKVLVEVGKRTLVDLSQAKAKHSNDKLNVVSSRNAYRLSLSRLKLILGIDESDSLEIVPPNMEVDNEKIPLDHWLLNDPYINTVDKQIEQGEIRLKLSQSRYLPTVSFNVAYGTNYSSQRQNIFTGQTINFWDQLNQNRTFYGNIAVSVPIFDGFQTRLSTKIVKQELRILQYEKEKITQERKQVVTEGTLELNGTKEELLAMQLSYEANKTSYEALAERYQVGKSSSIELYKALTDLNISEFNLISKKYTFFYKQQILKHLLD